MIIDYPVPPVNPQPKTITFLELKEVLVEWETRSRERAWPPTDAPVVEVAEGNASYLWALLGVLQTRPL